MDEQRNTPTFTELVDWIDGRLATDAAAGVAARVDAGVAAGDETLRATVAWLRAFRAQARGALLASPPEPVRREALRLFEVRERGQGAEVGSPVRDLIARLIRSVGAGAAPAGARGAGIEARRRQLTYECDVADIALNINVRDGSYRVNGQVLPVAALDVAAAAIQLMRADIEVAATRTDANGEFAFGALAPGSYTIVIVTGDHDIRLAPVDLA